MLSCCEDCDQNPVWISVLCHTCHISNPSHSAWSDYSNKKYLLRNKLWFSSLSCFRHILYFILWRNEFLSSLFSNTCSVLIFFSLRGHLRNVARRLKNNIKTFIQETRAGVGEVWLSFSSLRAASYKAEIILWLYQMCNLSNMTVFISAVP